MAKLSYASILKGIGGTAPKRTPKDRSGKATVPCEPIPGMPQEPIAAELRMAFNKKGEAIGFLHEGDTLPKGATLEVYRVWAMLPDVGHAIVPKADWAAVLKGDPEVIARLSQPTASHPKGILTPDGKRRYNRDVATGAPLIRGGIRYSGEQWTSLYAPNDEDDKGPNPWPSKKNTYHRASEVASWFPVDPDDPSGRIVPNTLSGIVAAACFDAWDKGCRAIYTAFTSKDAQADDAQEEAATA